MKTVDSPFTEAQFQAARFIVARLRAEACEEPFKSEDVGIRFTKAGELPAAFVDDGTVISTTDFIRASLLLVWSLVMDMSEEEDVTPLEIVQAIGLSLAENDPA